MTTTKTEKLTAFEIGAAATGLDRIRDRLYTVERATRRAKTPGRVAEIEAADDLSGWDATLLESAAEAGIDLLAISHRAQEAVDAMLADWQD